MVKRRVRHTSSAVGRPAGTGARSHWSSSGTQREEEGGGKEGGVVAERERESEAKSGELLVGDYLLKEAEKGDSRTRRWEEKRRRGRGGVLLLLVSDKK